MGTKSEMPMKAEAGGVLGKADAIIDALARHGALGPAELAELTGIPRSTVYRLVEGLTGVGLTTAQADGRAGLSLEWVRLADRTHRAMVEWAGAHAILVELAEMTGQTAFLTVLSGFDTVCIDWAEGRGIDALVLRPGRTLPLHAGAAGRVALAFLPPAEVDRYLEASPFEGYNDRTLTTAEALRADITLTRKRGYALSLEDVTIGIGAIGIPLIDAASARVLGSVSLGGFVDDINSARGELFAVLRSVQGRLLADVPG